MTEDEYIIWIGELESRLEKARPLLLELHEDMATNKYPHDILIGSVDNILDILYPTNKEVLK